MSNLFYTHQSNMNKPKNQGKFLLTHIPFCSTLNAYLNII